MPDTPDNQKVYPQNDQQKPGLGFPIARMAILTSMATCMALAIRTYVVTKLATKLGHFRN